MAYTSQTLMVSIIVPIAFYIILSSFLVRNRNPKGLPLPPGPPGLPLIGNAHQVFGKNMVTVVDNWAKQYGEFATAKASAYLSQDRTYV